MYVHTYIYIYIYSEGARKSTFFFCFYIHDVSPVFRTWAGETSSRDRRDTDMLLVYTRWGSPIARDGNSRVRFRTYTYIYICIQSMHICILYFNHFFNFFFYTHLITLFTVASNSTFLTCACALSVLKIFLTAKQFVYKYILMLYVFVCVYYIHNYKYIFIENIMM